MKNYNLLFSLFLLNPTYLGAIVFGSNTAVSRQAPVTFPLNDSDNEMRGFAAFEQGFNLDGATTVCTYNDLLPISGNITLNGGKLTLSQDLIIEQALLKTIGQLEGNNYSLVLSSNTEILFPELGADVLSKVGTRILSSINWSISWNYDGQYIASGSDLGNLNVLYYNSTDYSLTLSATAALTAKANSVRWHPSANYIAFGGNQVNGATEELQVWLYNGATATLTKKSGVNSNKDVYAVAWHPSGNYLATGENITSQEIKLYSFSSETISALTGIDLSPNRNVSIDALDWDATGNYLIAGVASDFGSAAELLVFYFNGSTLTVTAQADIGPTVRAVDYTDSYIAVGLSGGSERLRIYKHNVSSGGTLTELTSAYVGESAIVYTVDWDSGANNLLVGTETIAGKELKVYAFDKVTNTLSLIGEIEVGFDVFKAYWRKNDYIFAGASNSNSEINIYRFADTFSLKNLKISYNQNLKLNHDITLKGNVSINGKGNVFDLNGNTMFVDSGASLLFENLTLKNISGNSIQCLDNVGTISLKNVAWSQSGNFSFENGRLDILDDVIITGGAHGFAYNSSQISTIKKNTTLSFDAGMTFSYAPSVANKNLLAMEDVSSVLHLYETSLYSTTTGLQVTKGTLVIEGTCPIISDATVEAEGIMIGDGTAQNDVTVKILPESGLRLDSGYFVYKNSE